MKKKKIETEHSPEYKVYIPHAHCEEIIRERDPEDEWDNDDTCHNYSFYGELKLTDIKDYWQRWDFILTEKPKEGDLFFLVNVYYDTGDSFHRENNVLCMIGLYKDVKDAQAVKEAIEKDMKENKDSFDCVEIELPVEKRKESIGINSWKGYFESFKYADIEILTFRD
jgi:hypothetical protein